MFFDVGRLFVAREGAYASRYEVNWEHEESSHSDFDLLRDQQL